MQQFLGLVLLVEHIEDYDRYGSVNDVVELI